MGGLVSVGGRLAVVGVDLDDHGGPWHIMKPGGFHVPQLGDDKTIGTALCGRYAVTNGYAADFGPQHQRFCPACLERL